jgi:uncharacterized protein (DUF169 family)
VSHLSGEILPAVGVRLLRSAEEFGSVPEYCGVSYCDAVSVAAQGQALRVMPGSLQVCQWSPPVLGLKAAENSFERRLAPTLAYPVPGLLLAPLDRCPAEPQVVLVRAAPRHLQRIIDEAGRLRCVEAPVLWSGHRGQLACSAAPLFAGEPPSPHHRFVIGVNHVLAALARSRRWQALTYRLFRSYLATSAYDVLISHALADMSICRNSTVIPLTTGKVNVSFFCSGGITWGHNDPDHLTSGWPWHVYRQLPFADRGGDLA